MEQQKLINQILVGMANISLFAETSKQVMRQITTMMSQSVDETLVYLEQSSVKKVQLFKVDELPEYNEETSSFQLPTVVYTSKNTLNPPKKKLSELEQQLSSMKVNKEDDLKRERDFEAFIENSTLDDVCGNIRILTDTDKMFDEEQSDPQPRRSIIISVKKLPEQFLQNPENANKMSDHSTDKLQSFQEEKQNKNNSSWSQTSKVQYEMTDYSSNESSNIDDYQYQWKDTSSQKKDGPLFQFNKESLCGGVFDFPLTSQDNFSPKSAQLNSPKKKKRLYCNNKKIPNWASKNETILAKFENQTSHCPFQSNNVRANHKLLFPNLKEGQRGSSANWSQKKREKIVDAHDQALDMMQKLHHENIKSLYSPQVCQLILYIHFHRWHQRVESKISQLGYQKVQKKYGNMNE